MSPPIRDGSGSSIGSIRLGDGTEIAEVRTGAGDVLFGKTELPSSDTAQFQYDAQLLDGFADGDTVSNWTDDRVSGVTISGQATYRDPGINGFPALDHDGSDDGFASNQTTLNLPVALIGVVSTSSLPSSEETIIGPAGDSSDRLKLGASNGAWFAFGGGASLFGTSDTKVQLVSCLSDGSGDVVLREDGSQTTSDSAADNNEGMEAVSVGKLASFGEKYWTDLLAFAEIHQNITEAELAAREQEVANYWDITL